MSIKSWSTELLANQNVTGAQADAEVAALAGGGFVITWEDYSVDPINRVQYRVFDDMGAPVTDDMTFGYFSRTSNDDPAVTAVGDGFAISVQGSYTPNYQPVTALFDADGNKISAFGLNYGAIGSLYEPTILTVGDEIWSAIRKGSNIEVRRYDDQLSSIATFSMGTSASNARGAELANGNVAFTWQSSTDVFLRIVSPTGSLVAGDVTIAASALLSSPTVTALQNGQFVLTYVQQSSSFPYSGYDILARVYYPTLSQYKYILVNDLMTAGDQTMFATTPLANGGFMVVWYDNTVHNIYASTYSGTGSLIDGSVLIADSVVPQTNFDHLDADLLADGRVVVTWDEGDAPGDPGSLGVSYKIIDPRDGNVVGTSGDNTLHGGASSDDVYGLGGNDVLIGGLGNDFLDGGTNGVAGDTASFQDLPTAVNADLAAGIANAGASGIDTLFDIENLRGTDQDDTLTGDANDNVLEGGRGADQLIGGAGSDTASYEHSSSGVTVELQYGIIQGGDAEGDTLVSIENLTGSSRNDLLYGDPGVNVIHGGGGDDHIKGLNGADKLFGDDGDDWLYVDNPDTVADGGAGTDRLFVVNGTGVSNAVGSTSIEIAWGNAGDDTFDGTGAAVGLSLRGLGGDDILTGGDYDDYINGDAGADELRGGAGTDRLYVDAQDTVIDAGTGNDDRLFVTGTAGVTIGMAVAHAEIAYGNAGNDTFNGLTSTVALTLHGKSGNDTLIGGDMNDRLYGEGNAGGGDTLNGSLGNDYLFGGTNAGGWAERDQFVFDANWGDDRIFDFADNGFEKIDFSSIAGITGLGDLTITDGVGYARIAYSDTAGWDASIRVDGVHAADLGTNDFIFV